VAGDAELAGAPIAHLYEGLPPRDRDPRFYATRSIALATRSTPGLMWDDLEAAKRTTRDHPVYGLDLRSRGQERVSEAFKALTEADVLEMVAALHAELEEFFRTREDREMLDPEQVKHDPGIVRRRRKWCARQARLHGRAARLRRRDLTVAAVAQTHPAPETSSAVADRPKQGTRTPRSRRTRTRSAARAGPRESDPPHPARPLLVRREGGR
jgi:hypothetical protein